MKLTIAVEIDGLPDDTSLAAGSATNLLGAAAASAAVAVIAAELPERVSASDVAVRFSPEFVVPASALLPPPA